MRQFSIYFTFKIIDLFALMDQIFDLLLLKKYIGPPQKKIAHGAKYYKKEEKSIDFRFITIWPYEVI